MRSPWPTILVGVLAAAGTLFSAEPVDFPHDVEPILLKHCIGCHGPEKQKAGLRLDYRSGLLLGGDHGPAMVEGDSAASRLIKRVTGTDPDGPAMPFEKDRLSDEEIGLLRRWIDGGAAWPDSPPSPPRRTSKHWAFQPVSRPAISATKNRSWPRNALDSFILLELENKSIKPSPEADRYTLIRRVYLDLLGMPPTISQVDEYVADKSPDAYGRMVDSVLNNPAYGERWGRHWLDQARYADSNGYAPDAERTMWPWRDWVIAAINRDVPFDRFTVEQLAGDLLPSPTRDQLVATGFHRNTLINAEGGTDNEQFRNEEVVDRVNTTASVWLGLTVACAQCHTHKFDPITQKEFYQLFAFFNSDADNNGVEPRLELATPQQAARRKSLDDRIAAIKKSTGAATEETAKKSADAELKKLGEERKQLERQIPDVMIMRPLDKPRPTFIHVRGDFLRHGAAVQPGTPEVLPPLSQKEEITPPTRLDLARWLVRGDHPLTARVTVNRIWMRLFGTGLVETENDFGTQSTPPTHPRLLDWLADEFVRGGWSVKKLHKMIVTSATYRQSSHARADLAEVDPLNRLLARQNRFRVEGEIVRDQALAAAGVLTNRIGGPSVYLPQPEGVYAFTQFVRKWETETGPDRFRRTMYAFFYRSAPYPLLTTFDAPDFQSACTRRVRSNTPLQSLTAANDEGLFEIAQQLAWRVVRQGGDSERDRIARMFRYCLARNPTELEMVRLAAYRKQQFDRFAADPSAARLAAPNEAEKPVAVAAWVAVARAILNLDEFVTRE